MSKELIEQLAKEHGVYLLPDPPLGPPLDHPIREAAVRHLVKLEAFAKAYAQTQGQSYIPTVEEVAAWNVRNDFAFQDKLDQAKGAIEDARSMHLLNAAPMADD